MLQYMHYKKCQHVPCYRTLLFKIDPKLANLTLTKVGKGADRFLFGNSIVKDLGHKGLCQYVGMFNAIDKAQTSLHRVFPQQVSGRAGRSRGHLSGQGASGSPGPQRGPTITQASFQGVRNSYRLLLGIQSF